jgi:hypothetical protein
MIGHKEKDLLIQLPNQIQAFSKGQKKIWIIQGRQIIQHSKQ